MEFLETCLGVLGQLAPFLLLGFVVAGLLHAYVPERLLAQALGGTGLGPITRGAFIGVPLPLCSCSVIPVAVELRRSGAGRGATASFMVATPETGADSISTSFAVLHPMMAVFRPLAALVTAIGTGLAIERWTTEPAATPDPAPSCCGRRGTASGGGARGLLGGMRYAFVDLFAEVGIYLLPAIAVTALLTVWIDVPLQVTSAIESPLLQMLVLLGLGMPVYVCATAATPVAAALILGGFSPGAALVFLLAGPATNLVTISAVANNLGRRAAVLYTASIAGMSLAFGALLDALYSSLAIGPKTAAGRFAEHGGWLQWSSAAVLGALVIWHLLRRFRRAASR